MPRYIDADKLSDALGEMCEGCSGKKTDYCINVCDVHNFAEMINEADDADVVEVVRCKDCKWAESYRAINGGVYLRCNWSGVATLTNNYCSFGERKEKTNV